MATDTNRNLRLDEDETFETGEAPKLEDGAHRGTISSAQGEQTPPSAEHPKGLRYWQLVISPDDQPDMKLRYGCPMPADGKPITNQSKLGKLMLAFGLAVPGPSYTLKQLREAMEGKAIRFQVVNKPARRGGGTFAEVVDDSIKPVKSA